MSEVVLDRAYEMVRSLPADHVMTAGEMQKVIEAMAGCGNCYVPDKDRSH